MQFLQQLPFPFLFLQQETKQPYSQRAGEWQQRRKAFVSSFLAAVVHLAATKHYFIVWYRLGRTSKGHQLGPKPNSKQDWDYIAQGLVFEFWVKFWISPDMEISGGYRVNLFLISAVFAAVCLNVQRKKRRHSKCSALCSTPVLPITRSWVRAIQRAQVISHSSLHVHVKGKLANNFRFYPSGLLHSTYFSTFLSRH